jgi:hypothetical protein
MFLWIYVIYVLLCLIYVSLDIYLDLTTEPSLLISSSLVLIYVFWIYFLDL